MSTNVSKKKQDIVRDAMPATALQISESTGIGKTVVNFAIAQLRKRGEAYVGGWEKRRAHAMVAIYCAGSAPDVPAPDRDR